MYIFIYSMQRSIRTECFTRQITKPRVLHGGIQPRRQHLVPSLTDGGI